MSSAMHIEEIRFRAYCDVCGRFDTATILDTQLELPLGWTVIDHGYDMKINYFRFKCGECVKDEP